MKYDQNRKTQRPINKIKLLTVDVEKVDKFV